MKILGLSVVLLLCIGSAYADSNPTITDLVDSLNGRVLVCTASNGNVIRVKGRDGELVMTARFATDGYDASNDDGPPQCLEKICEQEASTDSDSGGMAMVNVYETHSGETALDLTFGDDNQNHSILYLPVEAVGDIQQGQSFSANGVYSPDPENRPAPAGGVKIETKYDCRI